jgi:phosphoserine phosphatase
VSELRPRFATVIFDVDSTLATIEGIDWLAGLRDAAIARECAELTDRAMAGEFPIDAVYVRRLVAIEPTAGELAALGEAYRAAVVPGAAALIAQLHAAGVDVHLLSGRLRVAILPLAAEFGVHADHARGVAVNTRAIHRARGDQPLATQPGKALVLRRSIRSAIGHHRRRQHRRGGRQATGHYRVHRVARREWWSPLPTPDSLRCSHCCSSSSPDERLMSRSPSSVRFPSGPTEVSAHSRSDVGAHAATSRRRLRVAVRAYATWTAAGVPHDATRVRVELIGDWLDGSRHPLLASGPGAGTGERCIQRTFCADRAPATARRRYWKPRGDRWPTSTR